MEDCEGLFLYTECHNSQTLLTDITSIVHVLQDSMVKYDLSHITPPKTTIWKGEYCEKATKQE